MPEKKINEWEQLALITMYAAGFEKEARDYALSLGCTKYYATVLHKNLANKISGPSFQEHTRQWKRAIANGKIII